MFQFPFNPFPGQTFTPVAGVTYRWSGTAWHLIAGPGSFITTADADTRYVNIDEAQNTTNRIINGKFAIDQRNAGAIKTVVAGNTGYFLDRWGCYTFGPGAFTVQRVDDPLFTGEYRAVIAVTTAVTPSAGDVHLMTHAIEGFNIADCNFGTAQASPITLSFEVESTVTGQFSIRVASGSSRSYIALFTVSAANTRETKTITVPGDTTGTWLKTNGSGLDLGFVLAAGSTYTTTANVWTAGQFYAAPGSVNFMATAGNTIRFRNVRLYKGSVDFGPDRRLYAEELALCQRYYCSTFADGIVPGPGQGYVQAVWGSKTSAQQAEPSVAWSFPVPMRATPTITLHNWSSTPPGNTAGQWSAGAAASANARIIGVTNKTAFIDNTDVSLPGQKYGISIVASAEL